MISVYTDLPLFISELHHKKSTPTTQKKEL